MKRARHQQGSVVFDRRRKVWNFLICDNGVRRTKKIGSLRDYPTKAVAWRAAEAFKRAEPTTNNTPPLVKTLVEQYRKERMPQRYSTRRSYDVWIDNYILPRWGSRAITEVQARPVELWLQSLPLAPRSKTGIRGMLRVLLDFAQWCGDIEPQRNPMELVQIKGATRRVRKPRSLTVEEFHKMFEHLREPFRTIALVSVSLGLRISEALALKWCDVDWLNSKLAVQRAIVRQRLDDVKTIYSERQMPIDSGMVRVLEQWKQRTGFSTLDDWIFASPVKLGRLPWSADAVNDAYGKAAMTAGIEKVSTHTMRHTFRSWLDATGASISVQKQLMRHSSIKTTMDVYGAIVTGEMVEASSRVAGLALKTDCTTDCKPS